MEKLTFYYEVQITDCSNTEGEYQASYENKPNDDLILDDITDCSFFYDIEYMLDICRENGEFEEIGNIGTIHNCPSRVFQTVDGNLFGIESAEIFVSDELYEALM